MKTGESWIGNYWTFPVNSLARLCYATEQTCLPGIRRRQLVRRRWLLEFAFTPCGQFLLTPGMREWRVIPRATARLIAPGRIRRMDTSQVQHPLHFVHLGFDRPDAAIRRMIDTTQGFAWFKDTDGRLGKMMVGIARMLHRMKNRGYWRAQDQFLSLLELLLLAERTERGIYSISTEKTPTRVSFVGAVDAYLLEHLAEKITLAAMSRSLHMAATTLSHGYRNAVGIPPMLRLRQLRMERVKGLLREGLPLKMIAMQTGLVDAFNLSRVFKRMTGLSPRQFLENTPY